MKKCCKLILTVLAMGFLFFGCSNSGGGGGDTSSPPVIRGWGTAERIETDDSGHAAGVQIGVDTSGNAIAVWSQDDGSRNNIWAKRYEE